MAEAKHESTGRKMSPGSRVLRWACSHPARSTTFIACMGVGIVLSLAFLPDDLSLARKILGGALLGGLSWLLPMMGRLLD